MLSRFTLLRVVAVVTVLTMAAVAGAKMRRLKPAQSSESQPVATVAQADASTEAQHALINGRGMYPLGVPTGLAAHHGDRAATQAMVSDHLRDLEELRTSRSEAPLWGNSNWRRGGGSSGFGHGFGSAGASFGGVGFGGGRAPKSTTTAQTTTPASTTGAAAKSPAFGKTPGTSSPAPRAPSAAPAPTVIAAPPVVAVAPPIFANQTTPIPVLTGTTAPTVEPPAGSLGGATGGGTAPLGGTPLSKTPEPASLLLIATGLAAVVGVSRRRQRKP